MSAIAAGALDRDLANFLVDCQARGHREDTIRLRRGVLQRLSRHVYGKPLIELSNDEVYAFFLQFRKLTPASRNSYGAALKSFYRYALRRGLIEVDPTSALPMPKVPANKPRPITAEQLHQALQHADTRMRLWNMLGAGAGPRAGEIAILCREHVDTSIRPPAIEVVNGKGGKDRTVTIGDHLATELTAWRVKFGRMWRVSPGTVSGSMSAYFERLGIPATAHSLRHTYASTLYAQSGSDTWLVQSMLGRASLNSTQIYTAFEPRKAVEAIDVVDQLLADAAALPLEARHRVAEALRRMDDPAAESA